MKMRHNNRRGEFIVIIAWHAIVTVILGILSILSFVFSNWVVFTISLILMILSLPSKSKNEEKEND